VDDLRRIEEIEGRLAEMAYAIGRLEEHPSLAARYLRQEAEELRDECREHAEAWAGVLARVTATLERLEPLP